MNAGALHYLSIAELAALLRARQVSSVEVTRAMLSRIEALDQKLHSYALRKVTQWHERRPPL